MNGRISFRLQASKMYNNLYLLCAVELLASYEKDVDFVDNNLT